MSTSREDLAANDQNFISMGELVDPIKVPDLVLAGRQVWSYGYDANDTAFTTIEVDDLWAWQGDPMGQLAISWWGPFRVSPP